MQLFNSQAPKLLAASSSMSCSSRQQQCQMLLRSRQQPSTALHLSTATSSSNAASMRHVCQVPAAAGLLPRRLAVLCGSTSGSKASSSTKKKAATGNRTKAAPSSSSPLPTSSGTVAAAATAAAASVATATTTRGPSSSTNSGSTVSPVVSIANPPIVFSNNIVPASPLVVTSPPRSPDDYSSDEELDEACSPERTLGGSPTGTGRTAAYRCLVLDSRYLPVNVVSWFRAVVMDESGKVDVLEYHPNGFAYSAYKTHPLPAVLRVRTFVDVHEFTGRLSLTRKNIMLRDHNRCQYCGSCKELTLDHVVPVCRGGLNSWTNLVTACMACNQRKGNKSLAQLGWTLPQMPREPRPQEIGVIAGISKNDLEHPPLPWVPYLATFKQMLDKAQRRAAAAAAATSNNSYAAAADLGASAAEDAGFSDAGLVTVTVHAAGPNSKAAKAAATGGGVKASTGKSKFGRL